MRSRDTTEQYNRVPEQRAPERGHRHAKLGAVLLVGALATGATGIYAGTIYHDNKLPGWAAKPASSLPKENRPRTTTLICPADAPDCDDETALASMSNGTRSEVPIDEVPDFLEDALIADENDTFHTDSGVSARGLMGAIIHNIGTAGKEGSIASFMSKGRGGSTITQQTVKLMGLNDLPRSNNIEKGLYEQHEWELALRMKLDMTDDEIMEKYVNLLPGGRNATGVDAISQALYGVPISDLDPGTKTRKQLSPEKYDEKIEKMCKLAIIAGATKDPYKMDVAIQDYDDMGKLEKANYEQEMLRIRERHNNYTVPRMKKEKYITSDEAAEMTAWMERHFVEDVDKNGEPILRITPLFPEFEPSHTVNYGFANDIGARHAIDYVISDATKKYNDSLEPHNEPVPLPEGFRIKTTIIPKDQSAMYQAVQGSSTIMNSEALNFAGVSVLQDGSVAAMIGSDNYKEFPQNISLGKEGGGSGRPPGSTAKTPTYALLMEERLEDGIDPQEEMEIPRRITITSENGTKYTSKKNSGCERLGTSPPCRMQPISALAVSSNMFPLLVAKQTSVEEIAKRMKKLGLSVPDEHDPSILLGNNPQSPLRKAGAMAGIGLTFGRSVTPRINNEIEDQYGNTVWKHEETKGDRVFSSDASQLTIEALQEVVRTGTGKSIMPPTNGRGSFGGKSGNAEDTDLSFDFLGCDSRLGSRAGSMWVGYPKGHIKIKEWSNSYEVGKLASDYIAGALDTGNNCDISEKANMPKNLKTAGR